LGQQRVFASEGVDLSRIVFGHCGDTDDLDYLRSLLDAGSSIGSDRFGLYRRNAMSLESRVAVIAELCRLGYADRIVLSHDSVLYNDRVAQADAPGYYLDSWRLTHLSDEVMPLLRDAGVTQRAIETMMVENPRRILAGGPPY
jgi:phosphotriesterase-related protein